MKVSLGGYFFQNTIELVDFLNITKVLSAR